MFDTFPQLETKHLVLRKLHSGDAESLFAVLGDEEVTEFYDDEVFRDVSQAGEQIEAWAAGFSTRRCVRWGIAQRENGKIIGTCGYYGFHRWHKRAGIGYELARSFWRQGIMTEALDAIIEFGFERAGLNRIEAVVMPENRGSVKLLGGLSFHQEGVLREYENWGNKGCVDLMMFSLLRREYEGG
ncbi:MAG: GNAT family N-acetyltransferase [Chloroflexi bacterium]|nr:GNAT family N-acetyltransferase [Chloroflexota bacterium]